MPPCLHWEPSRFNLCGWVTPGVVSAEEQFPAWPWPQPLFPVGGAHTDCCFHILWLYVVTLVTVEVSAKSWSKCFLKERSPWCCGLAMDSKYGSCQNSFFCLRLNTWNFFLFPNFIDCLKILELQAFFQLTLFLCMPPESLFLAGFGSRARHHSSCWHCGAHQCVPLTWKSLSSVLGVDGR